MEKDLNLTGIPSYRWSPNGVRAYIAVSVPGAIAQMVERLDRTQEVSGSNPLSSTSAP